MLFEAIPEVPADVARLDALEDAHQVVEDRPEAVIGGQPSHKLVNPELVLVKDVIKVEGNDDLSHFGHDFGGWVAFTEVLIEEGEKSLEDI